ncbi:cleavage and polyadenylation specificity factor subunit 1 [Octopus sinensis]|uniref:Cleavage and polyadenylation specificity factor subunit 1 n=1 Tax=Octopus sinensis TaxID=2607531 RepID=A0A6P7SJ54_9MOLL|nr:cleavage and polyadenylation specificity factor subunit 1 [Octopus sinensis]
MYGVYRPTHAPTGIEHCIYCNFFNNIEKSLIIAGVNQLHVFRLTPEEAALFGDKLPERIGEIRKKLKLECMLSFSLFGNVMSMKSVKLVGAQRDALLLSFMDAKLSLVEYDPGTHDLKTLSLHYFEEQELKCGFVENRHLPIVRVDPDGRCAAMLIYGRHLTILPFRHDVSLEEGDTTLGCKPPILSSYLIDLRSMDEKITNVLDIQFLHGYYEPTIFILYEPLQTWSGRTAVRTDTCSIVAISLNIQQKVHPVIWSLTNLPFDCFCALPIPKPIGGVVVFAVNSLLYLNQSVPPYGVSLNGIALSCTAFPLKPQEGVRIALDCCQSTLISFDKLVLSLKGGELYVLTLVVDGMRSVKSFHFDKAASSVLTTCMCQCEEGYLFLGSRLGNSLLLKYTEKMLEASVNKIDADGKKSDPPCKKKRTDNSEVMASDVSQIDDLDELEVYGEGDAISGTTITSFTFEVCDSILNIGPCGRMVMGEPAFLSEEFCNTIDPDLELVTTSGYSKNGALSVLQRSIRPQVVTTFELFGCLDMWTVFGCKADSITDEDILKTELKDENEEKSDEKKGIGEDVTQKDGKTIPEEDIEDGHTFLILSKSDSSMILQTGQEIMELDHSGFSTQTPTVFAGNIGDNKYIVQVSPMGVRLLEGVKQLQHIPIDVGSPIVHCSVADPFLLVMSEEGQVVLLSLRADNFGSGVRLAVTKPQLQQKNKIISLCAYKDLSGLFTTTTIKADTYSANPLEFTKVHKIPEERVSSNLTCSFIDDEDELLYGESESVFGKTVNNSNKHAPKQSPSDIYQKKEIKASYWVVICRENGVLEIYTLPDFRMTYYVKNFPMGQKVLVDSVQMTELSVRPSMSNTSSSSDRQEKVIGDMPVIKELLLVGLGCRNSRPHLLARVDEDLLLYEAFPFYQTQIDNHLKIRFKKIQHNLILRDKKSSRARKKGVEATEDVGILKESHVCLMRYFEDITGYSGVFICGAYPHWIIMTARGSLRIHPMNIDGPITCFAPFHNINCPKGFLYFNKAGELRICVLPTHLTYDSPWPVRKVPLRSTPYFVVYHPESKTYAVVSSTQEPSNKLPKTTTDEREFEIIERDDRFVYPMTEKYCVQLFSPVSWEVIPNTKIEFLDWEHVTTLVNVSMRSEGTLSGYKGYCVMGTNFSLGEEVQSRGRIIIFDIIEVVPEPGQPLTKNKIKVIYEKEQKGPVTALAQVEGFLLSAIGQKLYIWTLKDNDLSGVAFIDTYIYIHTLSTLKNIILAGDLLKSVSVYRYQEELKVLSLVSRDIRPMEVYTVDFMVDNVDLCFVVTDRLKNLLVYFYQPEARKSCGGQRLLRRADMNIGSHVLSTFRVRCKLSDQSIDRKMISVAEKRHITFFATLDGSIGFVMPISEKVYRRLLMLQNAMATLIPHIAGLNPKAYRAAKATIPELFNPSRNILDGELLWKYTNLSVIEKSEVARRIGITVDQIIDDLMEIDHLSSHF